MPRNKPKDLNPYSSDDAANQAGWLFADSFLALMIIFLATISFVPSPISIAANRGLTPVTTGTNMIEGLVFTYDKYDENKIKSDISKYLTDNKLDSKTEILFAKIVAGYANEQGSEAASLKAIEVSVLLKKSQITYFKNTSFDLSTSTFIAAGSFSLRLTLGQPR